MVGVGGLAWSVLMSSLIDQPLFLAGSSNLWNNPIIRNSWRLVGGVPNVFGLPSKLFRCMASSGSGNDDFARPISTEEAVTPLPLYSWPDKQVS
jgi:demethylphylloquinone reductase